jgi:two-component system sensor histidine kinase HydH
MTALQYRFFWPFVLITACLVSLCVVVAVSLFRQQQTITGVLRENVTSRKAAADLRGSLNTLIALETHHVESVADLHARAQVHVDEIRRQANHPTEQTLAARLDEGFTAYLQKWQSLPPANDPRHASRVTEATEFLEANVLIPCREIEGFNDQQIEQTTSQHERVLGQLAWGMAGIGGLGGIAGLVLGYGVARGLSRSIHRLQVRIRDAAGKLAHTTLPEIVFIGEGGFEGLHGQIDRLSSRIEQVVERLQEREREVLRAEQLAAVGQLAAGVGHEIRNPLTAIKMLVQSALERRDQGGLTADDLGIIEGEIRRMERSLQTFLEFARPPRMARQRLELQGVLGAVLGLVRGRAEKQGVSTRLESPEGPATLTADPNQLQQVFVNLALNALDAMAGGGTLSFAVRQCDGQVVVEVSDTGPGVPQEMMSRLFQPFASDKDTGLGLGLVISQRIVEDHGGKIEAANRPGGASFVVTLPVGSPPEE